MQVLVKIVNKQYNKIKQLLNKKNTNITFIIFSNNIYL